MSSQVSVARLTDSSNWLLFAGLIGLSVSATIQLTGLDPDKRTAFSQAAVYCFAAATPILAANMIAEIARPLRPGQLASRARKVFGWAGVGAGVAGLACCFAHLDLPAAAVFVVVGVGAMIVSRWL